MDRTTRTLFAAAILALIGIVGAVAVLFSASPSAVDPALPRQQAIGVIVGVASEGLTTVTGFTLREEGGTILDFALALEDPTAFAPAHLAEHQATAAPVVVTYVTRDDALVAVAIEDWLGPSSAP